MLKLFLPLSLWAMAFGLGNSSFSAEGVCLKELLATLKFYSTTESRLVSYPHLQSEAESILFHSNAYFLALLSRSPAKQLKLKLLLTSGSKRGVDLPVDLIERLSNLSALEKTKLIEILNSENHSVDVFERFLRKAFSNEIFSTHSILKIFESYDKYHHLTVNLEDIKNPDGTLNIAEILQTGRSSKLDEVSDRKPLVKVVKIKPKNVAFLIYIIGRNEDGTHYMKLSILKSDPVTLNERWGHRHHSHVASGREVEFAGSLFLTMDGKIKGIDLSSGHYMFGRQREIDEFVSSQKNVDVSQISALTITLDRSELSRILTKEFGLVPADSFYVLVRKKEWESMEAGKRLGQAIGGK